MEPNSELTKARATISLENPPLPWNFQLLAQHLEKLAGMFQRTSRDQHRELIAQFHDCAGKMPYLEERDFGAFVLEDVADSVDDENLHKWLYTEARFRATWCSQGGTASGECLARYRHVKRLDENLKVGA